MGVPILTGAALKDPSFKKILKIKYEEDKIAGITIEKNKDPKKKILKDEPGLKYTASCGLFYSIIQKATKAELKSQKDKKSFFRFRKEVIY